MNNLYKTALIILIINIVGCSNANKNVKTVENKSKQPNILWIVVEDLNPVFSCYGETINPTPTLDNLAKSGVLFKNAYTPAPVCSAARSAFITSTMPTTFGLHNHHSSRTVEDAIFLPEGVKTIPEVFKENGYQTFNHGKDDYNFIYDRKKLYEDDIQTDFWYTFSGTGDWLGKLSPDQPFFGQIQLEGGKLGLIQVYDKIKDKITPIDRSLVQLPPYYPNIPSVHEDFARHYDAARATDLEVEEIINQLKEKGLLNNTYVFFFADHGYKGIRHKQFLYDGGIQIPLIVAYFGEDSQIKQQTVREDLVSGIDIGTSSLALAGINIPKYMEGQNMFDSNFKRDFIIATRDRCDFSIDRIRAVRTDKYKYIKNYMPNRSYTQPAYRDRRAEFVDIKKMFDEGKLNDVQAKYWLPTKPEEELYDLENDPFEINNLAYDANYSSEINKLRTILNNWAETYGDKGSEPQNIYSLKFMYERWGERCVNEEFDTVKNMEIHNAPKVAIKK
ncbi:DUF229 domain-containing protein [Lutibacter sp. HS1-25]|uniref:sulfatase family protein n=1 Tax=Lutibacter sp. HS1-25 TaxID=2485000 RepID=UPI0010116DDC|nr:sulfatase [Lutibacter sp. HS1-25]RXP62727.1 DUF229 domain-containing protein [Lutibacter sp. HS1-25]